MKPTYFYHNFPRKACTDLTHGLEVLQAMLGTGLLLVPELTKLRAPGGQVIQEIVQERMCFTELAPDEVPKHAETFGLFALEYEPMALRQLGAVPVFYIPSNLDNQGLAAAGTVLASRMAYAQEFIKRLITDRDEAGADKAVFYAGLIDQLVSLEELYYTTEAVQNLFYPTEDLAYHDDHLHYYRQREWKIVPNFARGGVWEIQELTPAEKEGLIGLNDFFGNDLRAGERRIDRCRYFRQMEGKSTLAMAKWIIVPDGAVDEAALLVAAAGLEVPVVPLSALAAAV